MATLVLGFLVLPALSFALLYFPLLTRFSLTLVSPYPKAEVKRRLFAACLDASLFLTSLYFYQHSGSAWFVVAGAAYLLLRDAMYGRSIGKFFAGLAVVQLETNQPCSLAGSFRRNLVFLFPGVNVVAICLEAITVVRDPQGHRLGDRLARTQGVVGFGAKELAYLVAKLFQPSSTPVGRRVRPVPGHSVLVERLVALDASCRPRVRVDP